MKPSSEISPLIVALDVDSLDDARSMVASLGDAASFYKVGLELYAIGGMDFVRELKDQGHRVFLDLKLYDIGETVKRTVAQVARVNVDLFTVHASRGVMRAAVDGRGGAALQLLAVTVLTSVDDSDLRDDGYATTVSDLVELRVKNAIADGITGIVCSAKEVARVRELTGPQGILVTPGVRSAGAAAGDQKRVTTPKEALDRGATYLVIGRQVTRAADPRAEMLKIRGEIGR